MSERVLHCWAGRREAIEEEHGHGSDEWAKTHADDWQDGTCMLLAGHAGPHDFTDDSEIGVAFTGAHEVGE